MTHPGTKAKIQELVATALRARSAGEFQAARQLYQQILELDPDHHGALHDLGVISTMAGELPQTVEFYQRALRTRPAAADTDSNLGVVFKELGEPDRAIGHFSEAIRLRPDYAEAHNNLGTVLLAKNDARGALAQFRRAVELKPDDAIAWSNAGRALILMGGAGPAVEPLQRAVALAPDSPDARAALGAALFMLGRYPEAIAQLEQVLKLKPGRVELLADLVHARQHVCDWNGLDDDAATIRSYVVTAERCNVTPFFFMMLPGSTAVEQRLCAEKYARGQLAWAARRRPALDFVHERKPKSRLRIGYFTAHFHDHATMHSIAGVLERHDRSRFEVIGLSHGPDSTDAMRRRVRAALDDFVELRTLNDEEAARAIHARGIDLLIDAKGYSRDARPGILALRPAPVQAGYLVYPGTTGSDFLDYYIADRYIIPPAHAGHYSERIKYLPHTYQCNDSQRPQAAAPARGVAPARLVFAQTLRPAEQHRARIALADLCLDTVPCNAHVTASDALWAGVPLVTCSGDTHVGRAAGSMLRGVGLPELITTTLADYEALALRLARDPDALLALRRRLAANRASAPLFDTVQQTRDLEAVYEEMWREYLEGRAGSVP